MGVGYRAGMGKVEGERERGGLSVRPAFARASRTGQGQHPRSTSNVPPSGVIGHLHRLGTPLQSPGTPVHD